MLVGNRNKSNMPNVSPKEMFTFQGDSTLLIAHITSPNSLKNIKVNPQVCVSILDIFVQKGYQFKGYATIIDNKHPSFKAKAQQIIDLFGTTYPFTQLININIQKVKPIIAPSYILFPESTEASRIVNAMESYNAFITKPVDAVSKFLSEIFDTKILDGVVNGVGRGTRWMSGILRQTQSGNVDAYFFAMVISIVLIFVLKMM